MGLIKGGFLRIVQTLLYFLTFCTAAVILGVYAYFLSVLADRNVIILNRWAAVTGISGVGVLYTLIAVVLTCCLGGITFFGFVAIVFNIVMVGGFIAIAVLTRDARHSCDNNYLNTPLGGFATGGFGGEFTYSVSPQTACRLNQAAFACAIIGCVLFFIAALFQVLLIRSGKKEKRYGPSPANNYTSGSGNRNFWQRKQQDPEMAAAAAAPVAAGGLAAPVPDQRASYETGTTVGANQYGSTKPDGAHSGYYTQPQGTGVNPYGPGVNPYGQTTGTATNY